MSKQLSIKATLADGTEQIIVASKDQAVRIQATAKARYQLVDAQTGIAPAAAKGKRVGKDLIIEVLDADQSPINVIMENFADAEGALLVGEMQDGVLYEYTPELMGTATDFAALSSGDEFTYALGGSPVGAGALVPFVPQGVALLPGLGGLFGVGATVAAGELVGNLSDGTPRGAFSLISAAAQANSATDDSPAASTYAEAGVTGVNASNLAIINGVLNTAAVDGASVDTLEELQALVNTYNAILNAADGLADEDFLLSEEQYASLGLTGVNSAARASLLSEAIDGKLRADVDSVSELQTLADAVAAVMVGAAGGTPPTLEQLSLLGVKGVNENNLAALQAAIAATTDDGTEVDKLEEIQSLLERIDTATGIISDIARDNSATQSNPSFADYTAAGVTGVTATNLAAINSALNSTPVGADATDTPAEIQAIVDAYRNILASADGLKSSTPKPTRGEYAVVGVTGVDTAAKSSLLGDVVDVKSNDDVNTVAELQALADAVSAVMAGAAGRTGPTVAQLQALGLTGVNPANLTAVQAALEATPDDGSAVASKDDLQKLINPFIQKSTLVGIDAIKAAAEANSATEFSPEVKDYTSAGVTGVTDANLASMNSALDSPAVNANATDTAEEIQTLVNAYKAILNAADGLDNNATAPTPQQYTAIGVTGLTGANAVAIGNLLADVIDIKSKSGVDTVAEVQALADAATAVINAAGTGPAPTLAQLEALGLKDVNPANLPTIAAAIAKTADNGTGVDSLPELQGLVDKINRGLDTINRAAQANSATETSPSADDYAAAGVSGVTDDKLAAINSTLNTAAVNAEATNTAADIQKLVDAYQVIFNAADGLADKDTAPTPVQYATLGVTGVESAVSAKLLGDVIDAKSKTDVDTVGEVQALADAVAAVLEGAKGGTGPTLAELQALGLKNVNPANLAAIQKLIADTDDNGAGVDTVSKINALVEAANRALPGVTGSGLAAISAAAEANNATDSRPSVEDYVLAGASGVAADNLAAINSVLNTPAVNGGKVNSLAEVQGVVDAYKSILAAADGLADGDAVPTQAQFELLGLTGVDLATKANLLGDVIDGKTKADVDSVTELQALADAVAAVMSGASGELPPTLAQLQALGLKELNPANLAAVQAAIAGTLDNGTKVDSVDELQGLISGVNGALSTIQDAAKDNNATSSSPSAADYAVAGVSGVTADNLASVNSALNTAPVDAASVGTSAKIQALVDGYKAILDAADGQDNNATKPTSLQYAAIGVTGADSEVVVSLLGDVLDIKNKAEVDTVLEVQALADAVAAVMRGAAGGTAPTLAELQALGLEGLNPANLLAVQKAIADTANNGSAVDTLDKLQDLINPFIVRSTATGLSAITTAAQANSATESSPTADDYTKAAVTGVDSANLAAINSVLNTPLVNGAATDSGAKVQALVNIYGDILAAADGLADKDTTPTQAQYALLGLSGVDDAAKTRLLGEVINSKTKAEVDSVGELQALADAVAAVIAGAAGGTPPTLAQLQALGLEDVNPANLPAVQAAIAATGDDGTGADSLPELQKLVSAINQAVDAISEAAEANNATDSTPSAATYATAGVSGVTAANLAAINSALNSPAVNGGAADSAAEIQALVDAYKVVLAAADGTDNGAVNPTQAQYAALGVTGVNTVPEESLLGDVLDIKSKADVDSVGDLQALADAVAAVMSGAAGGTQPTLAQLQALGLTGVNPGNLASVLDAIAATNDNGTGVDSLDELKALVDRFNPPATATGLAAIRAAAQADSATGSSPGLTDYNEAEVTGVTTANLAAINSVLNTPAVNDGATDSRAEVQALVNIYSDILTAADGKADKDSLPTQTQYGLLGLTGIDAATKSSLLGDVIDSKTPTDVDSVIELQALANAVAAVIAAAGSGTPPTEEQLQALGLKDVNPANLMAIQALIEATLDNGTGVDSLPELQGLVDRANQAIGTISNAAEGNNATELTPTTADYATAGVKGVSPANLASINSVLNSPKVDGEATNTTAEIQALVDIYQTILDAADGSKNAAELPSQQEYSALGITGVDSTPEESLLGTVIDVKGKADVDTLPELQGLADAVSAVMSGAAGKTEPTLAQLQALGLTGLNPANLALVQAALAATPDNGSGADTQKKLQDIVDAVNKNLPNPGLTGLNAISAAAQANSATEIYPTLADYSTPGVTGVTQANLAAINSALNSPAVNGVGADTLEEVQKIVDAYQAILNAADGLDDNDTPPTAADYALVGVTGVDNAPQASLLGDVLDIKNKADVDTIPELQALAAAAAAVVARTTGETAPTLAQLQALGLQAVNPANLAAVQAAIAASPDAQAVDTLAELQGLVKKVNDAVGNISSAAQDNNATEVSPSAADYATAGVTGVTPENLSAINSALNTPSVNAAATDTAAEIQAVVDAYKSILDAADGVEKNSTKPTQAQYAAIGVTGVDTAPEASLLGDVLDVKDKGAVDTAAEVQALADAVAAVMSGAAGGAAPTLAQLQALGLMNLNPANLAAVQQAIAGTADDGTDVDSKKDLQDLIDALLPINTLTGLDAIKAAAQANSATEIYPTPTDYSTAGVTGVTPANLAAINSALNSAAVTGALTDTTAEVQALVDAYTAILAAADGADDNDAKPTEAQYTAVGVTGAALPERVSLLGDVIDIKAKADVDSVIELQALADAVDAVIKGASGDTPPTLAQLQSLGLQGLNPANLKAVQAIIAGTLDNGTQVDTLPELQGLVNQVNGAINRISEAAQADSATATSPSALDYSLAAVSGVTDANLPPINSAVNSAAVNGEATDTTAEIQAVVDGYLAILAAADGLDDNDAKPTQAQYAAMGVTGVDKAVEESLLGDVIDIQSNAAVNTVPKVQALAGAVAAVMSGAAGGVAPTLAQLQALGLTGVTADNLAKVQSAIAATPDSGTSVDTLAKLQALVDSPIQLPVEPVLNAITAAAQANDATNTTPSALDYSAAGATGVNADNLAALNSALNSGLVDAAAVDTAPELQRLVDGYNAILNAADGTNDLDPKPTLDHYQDIGLSGVTLPTQVSLLGDVVNIKPREDVDRVSEMQVLADAVAAVMTGAAGGPGPSLTELLALGLSGVNADNLAPILGKLADQNDNGTTVDSLDELQALVNSVNSPLAVNTISAAAEANNATPSQIPLNLGLAESVFKDAGVTGVNAINLPSILNALDSQPVNAEKTNTTAEIQALVNAYQAILNLADGSSSPTAVMPTEAQYTAIGVTGVNDPDEASLLGSVIDLKRKSAIDEVSELEALAAVTDKVMALAAVANGGTPPSPALTRADLEALGVTGLNAGNMPAVLEAIQNSTDDGSAVNTVGKLQALVASSTNPGVDVISAAAQNNTATNSTPSLADYVTAGVTGVTAGNLAAINSALDSDLINRSLTNTTGKIQKVVDGYLAVLLVADGLNDDDTNGQKPSKAQLEAIGVEGLEFDAEVNLLADVLDSKTGREVNTFGKISDLAYAVYAVIEGAKSADGAPSEEDLTALGLTGVNEANLEAIQSAILATDDSGSQIDSLPELQALINIASISQAAEDDTAAETGFAPSSFTAAGVTGVNAGNLQAILSALDTETVTGIKADSTPEIQAVVDAYKAVLDFANGASVDGPVKPTQQQYTDIGVTGISNPAEVSLLGDVIGAKLPADVDRVSKIQPLAAIVDNIIGLAERPNGEALTPGITSALTVPALESLGLVGVGAVSLDQLLADIRDKDDGSQVDTLPELQALISKVAIDTIKLAAQSNTAAPTATPVNLGLSEGIFVAAGVSGVSAINLDAVRSALDSTPVNGDATDTRDEVQAVVNAYQAILTHANGPATNGPAPTEQQYALIGVTGIDDTEEARLLGDIVGTKVFENVDRVPEIQLFANIVDKIMALAALDGGPVPAEIANVLTPAALESLGLVNLTDVNIPAVLEAIRDTANNGTDVDTLEKLQALIGGNSNPGINAISLAAARNDATNSSPTLADYAAAGVNGVNAGNLASINSTLNTASVNGPATDSTVEIQALVNAYLAIQNIADGLDDDDASLPTQAQFGLIGIQNIDSAPKAKLLGDVIDSKPLTSVDRAEEVQALATAAAAVIKGAGPDTALNPAPSLDQLTALGVTGVTADNLAAVQAAIRLTDDSGSQIDTLPELQALINIVKISLAAEANTATPVLSPLNVGLNIADFTKAGVTGVTDSNLPAIQSALDSAAVTGEKTNELAEIQAVVNAYQDILTYANGPAANGTVKPGVEQYALIGVTGIDDADEASLLSDVVGNKVPADVDRVSEIQPLAAIVDKVMALAALEFPAAPTADLTAADLQALGLTGVPAVDIDKLREAIRDTNNDGSGVNDVPELQALVKQVAIDTISEAAGSNTAASSGLTAALFSAADVTGVDNTNLAAINSALDSLPVTAELTNTKEEIQAVVNAYQAVLTFANGAAQDGPTKPTVEQYAAIGVTGIDDPEERALLGEVIGTKAPADVDRVSEIQPLATVVDKIMALAAKEAPESATSDLTAADLASLGVTGAEAVDLTRLREAIRDTANPGTDVDELRELQALIRTVAINTISEAAGNNTAAASSLSAPIFGVAGVTGVNTANLASINSALDSSPVTADKTNTTEEIQAVVSAYEKILAHANGSAADVAPKPIWEQYVDIGVTAINDSNEASLLGDVIGAKAVADIDRVSEIQPFADLVDKIRELADLGTGATIPAAITNALTKNALESLGLTGVNNTNLSTVLNNIRDTSSAAGVNTLPLLQTKVPSDTNPPAVSSIQIQSATKTGTGGFSRVIDEGDTITFEVNMNESVTVTGSPTLSFTMGSTGKSAVYNAGLSSSNQLIFTYAVTGTDFDHDGISFPANALNIPSSASILDGSNNAAVNTLLAIGANPLFRVDAMNLSSDPASTTGGLLIRGNTTGGNWYFNWDKDADGVANISPTQEDSGDYTAFAPVSSLLGTESNASINLALPSLAELQAIGTAGWPAAWNKNVYWSANVGSTASQHLVYDPLNGSSFSSADSTDVWAAAYKVIPA